MLRETVLEEDEIDLDNVVLSHYRVAKIRQQDLQLQDEQGAYTLQPTDALGSGKARDQKEEWLSQLIQRLNELFNAEGLSDQDMVNYAYTIRDKLGENQNVLLQIANNTPEQAMLGDFAKALETAIMDSSAVHENQMLQLLSDPQKLSQFGRLIFELMPKR